MAASAGSGLSGVPGTIIPPMNELRPSLTNQKCAAISSFEFYWPVRVLHNNQSECVIMTNKNGANWTNQTAKFLICIKWTNQGPGWSIPLYKQVIPLSLCSALWVSSGGCILSSFLKKTWIKFLLLPHPIFGTSVGTGLMEQPFVDKSL